MSQLDSYARPAITLALGLGLAVIAFSHAAAEPSAKWDQARVAGIAENLSKAASALYDAEYKAPYGSRGGMMGGHDFMDALRMLRQETKHLADALSKSASMDATIGSVRRIKELNDDLAEYGKHMPFVNPVMDKVAAFEDLIRQIMPYYGLDS
jgi:hypothetical protein